MQEKELVTIKATETVRSLAAKADQIQNASNALAVAHFLIEVQQHFLKDDNGQDHRGSDMAAKNPVALSVLNKLNHLAGLKQSRTDCFTANLDLAEGRDVQIEFR
mgnify:FL=1